jgi:hypothetical protein
VLRANDNLMTRSGPGLISFRKNPTQAKERLEWGTLRRVRRGWLTWSLRLIAYAVPLQLDNSREMVTISHSFVYR